MVDAAALRALSRRSSSFLSPLRKKIAPAQSTPYQEHRVVHIGEINVIRLSSVVLLTCVMVRDLCQVVMQSPN